MLRRLRADPVEVREYQSNWVAERTRPAFNENLRGARPGETREFDVTYPEDYRQKSLAGKTFRYRVEVQSIKHKVVPAADDELAKSVSEFATLEELRTKLRQRPDGTRQAQVGDGGQAEAGGEASSSYTNSRSRK